MFGLVDCSRQRVEQRTYFTTGQQVSFNSDASITSFQPNVASARAIFLIKGLDVANSGHR